jgi:hypothetical protein
MMDGGAEPPEGTATLPAVAAPASTAEEHLLSDGWVGEVRHVVEAHNGLAGKLREAQADLGNRMEAILQRLNGNVDKLEQDQISLKDDHGTQLQELRRQNEESRSTLEALVQEKFGELMKFREQDGVGHRDVEQKVKGLENSMSEVVTKVADLGTIALPKLQAEFELNLSREKTVRLADSEAAAAARSELGKKIERLAKELSDTRKALEASLGELGAASSSGVAEAKAAAEGFASKFAVATERQTTEIAELGKRLTNEAGRLEKFAAAEAQQALEVMRSDEGKRLAVLEGVVKQGEFERLSFYEKVAVDFAAVRAEIYNCQTSADEHVQETVVNYGEKFNEITIALEQRALVTQLESLDGKVDASLADGAKNIALAIANSECRERSEKESMQDHVETQYRQLKLFATEEGRSALNQARTDDRWEHLRNGFSEVESKCKAENRHLANEIETARNESATFCQSMEARCEEANAATGSRAAQVQQVVVGLGENVQELVNGLQRRDEDCERLERIVREVELRKWPWRCNMSAIGPFPQAERQRQRSSSPPGVPRGATTLLPQGQVDLTVTGDSALSANATGGRPDYATIETGDSDVGILPRTPAGPRPHSASRTYLRHQRVR